MTVKNQKEISQAEPEIHIAGIVVYCDPGRMQLIRSKVGMLPDAECHAESPDGKMVMTLETPNTRRTMDCMDAIRALPGVYDVCLVYQHAETVAAMEEEIQS